MKGVRCRIVAKKTFADVRAAERFAAATQTLIAALGEEDLILVESTIEVRLKTAPPGKGQGAARRAL
jgi:hypothetical protein